MTINKSARPSGDEIFNKILRGVIIITIAFIWIHSMMPGSVSSEESGFVMDLVRPFLELIVGKGNVTMHLVRKLAHFTEYFVLGMELTLYFLRRHFSLLLSSAGGLLVAIIDETIQIFADSRGPAVSDVLLDFSGVCTGVLIMCVAYMIIRRCNKSPDI